MKFLRSVKSILSSPDSSGTDSSGSGDDRKTTITLPAKALSGPNILDARREEGYLAGQLLVATPVIDNGCFKQSVVYVFAHTEEGAMGVIVNQPIERLDISQLLDSKPEPKVPCELSVYFGGPVERARGFILHSTDYIRDFTLAQAGDVAVTASNAILEDIVAGRGPRSAVLAVGYAGWSAGQLESEIEGNSWITVPGSAALVFDVEPELRWATAGQTLGIDMAFFSTAVGHA